jgi:hypothetical protein
MGYDYFNANGYPSGGPTNPGQRRLREFLLTHPAARPRVLGYCLEGCSDEPAALARDLARVLPLVQDGQVATALRQLIASAERVDAVVSLGDGC